MGANDSLRLNPLAMMLPWDEEQSRTPRTVLCTFVLSCQRGFEGFPRLVPQFLCVTQGLRTQVMSQSTLIWNLLEEKCDIMFVTNWWYTQILLSILIWGHRLAVACPSWVLTSSTPFTHWWRFCSTLLRRDEIGVQSVWSFVVEVSLLLLPGGSRCAGDCWRSWDEHCEEWEGGTTKGITGLYLGIAWRYMSVGGIELPLRYMK